MRPANRASELTNIIMAANRGMRLARFISLTSAKAELRAIVAKEQLALNALVVNPNDGIDIDKLAIAVVRVELSKKSAMLSTNNTVKILLSASSEGFTA